MSAIDLLLKYLITPQIIDNVKQGYHRLRESKKILACSIICGAIGVALFGATIRQQWKQYIKSYDLVKFVSRAGIVIGFTNIGGFGGYAIGHANGLGFGIFFSSFIGTYFKDKYFRN